MTTGTESSDAIVALLRSLMGKVETRVMHGATGLSLNGAVFGIISDDRLYYRADHLNRRDFEDFEAALREETVDEFCPRADIPGGLSYLPVPMAVLDEPEVLREWTRKAWEAAKRAQKASR